jgi:hypothetical protein
VSDPTDPEAELAFPDASGNNHSSVEIIARFVRVRLLRPTATLLPVPEAMGKGVVYSMTVQVYGCPVQATTAHLGSNFNLSQAAQQAVATPALNVTPAVAELWARAMLRSPPGDSGALEVVPPVTSTAATDVSNATVAGFFYTEAASPTVSAVSPNRGSTAGGTLLTLTGTGFETVVGNNNIMVGSVPCTVTQASPQMLKCVTGATNVQNGGNHHIQVCVCSLYIHGRYDKDDVCNCILSSSTHYVFFISNMKHIYSTAVVPAPGNGDWQR